MITDNEEDCLIPKMLTRQQKRKLKLEDDEEYEPDHKRHHKMKNDKKTTQQKILAIKKSPAGVFKAPKNEKTDAKKAYVKN